MTVEQRFADLESRLAFQEDALHALNDTVARQARELSDMRMLLRQLAGAVRGMQTALPGDDIPPHY